MRLATEQIAVQILPHDYYETSAGIQIRHNEEAELMSPSFINVTL